MDRWDDGTEERESGGSSGDRGGPSLAVGLVALLAVLAAWWTRPWWQGFVFGVLVERPSVAWGFGLAGLATLARLAVARYGEKRHQPAARALSLLAIAFVILAFTLFPLLGGWYESVSLAERTGDRASSLDTLADVDADRPRILPKSVGTQFASNSLQFPRHTVTEADITFVNGTPTWSFALRPDGAVNRFVTTQAGAAFVDMTTSEKRIEIVEREMACGPGMQVTDNLDWVLKKERYFVDYQDPFYVLHEGELYAAAPFTTYEHRWRFPTLYSVPTFGGVGLVDEDCEVTVLDPDEAREHPVLEGQPLYPRSLARAEVESMRYQNGIVNKLFTHEDELELAPLPGEGNDQPFLVVTEEGIQYVLAAEPFGKAQGIFEVWVLDARTGEVGVLKLDPASSLLGPRKAAQFLRKDNPRVDWSRMDVSEPLPAIVEDRLYWHVKVNPKDSAGLAFTAFVDADSGNVTETRSVDQVKTFLRGETIADVEPPGANATDQPAIQPEPWPTTLRLTVTNRTGATVVEQRLKPGFELTVEEGNRTLFVLQAPEDDG